jgi:anti-sigma factor RsiW
MSADHLNAETLGALVDDELAQADDALARAHLKVCHECTLKVVELERLKSATKRAAQRYTPSAATMARFEAQIDGAKIGGRTENKVRTFPIRRVLWTALAAGILVVISLTGWRVYRESDTLSAELLDQHLAVLSDASTPEVISSDKHTVKPWFQGKLPFSFNVPDPSALPAETSLVGGNLTYLEGKPTAMLLFTIHKHKVTVFVSQAGMLPDFLLRNSRAGFQMARANAAGLEMVGVSDVNRAELMGLMDVLEKAQ